MPINPSTIENGQRLHHHKSPVTVECVNRFRTPLGLLLGGAVFLRGMPRSAEPIEIRRFARQCNRPKR